MGEGTKKSKIDYNYNWQRNVMCNIQKEKMATINNQTINNYENRYIDNRYKSQSKIFRHTSKTWNYSQKNSH